MSHSESRENKKSLGAISVGIDQLFSPTDIADAKKYSIGGGGGPLKGLTADAMCTTLTQVKGMHVTQSLGVGIAAQVAMKVYGTGLIGTFKPIAEKNYKSFVFKYQNLRQDDFIKVVNEAVVFAVTCYFPRKIIHENLQQLVAQYLQPFYQQLPTVNIKVKINIVHNVADDILQQCCQSMPSYYSYGAATQVLMDDSDGDLSQHGHMLLLPASDGINQSERPSFARAAADAEENSQDLGSRHGSPPLPPSSLVPQPPPKPEGPTGKEQPPQEDDCFNTLGVIVGLVALFICAAEFSSFPWRGYDNVQELLVHLVQKEWVFMLVVVAAVMLMAVAMMPDMTCSSAAKLD